MWQHVFSRLGIGILFAMAASGFSKEGAIAAESAAAPAVQPPKQASSSLGVPAGKEPHSQTHVSLESICRVKGEGQSIFTKDGKLTLVLKGGYTSYLAAQEIAEMFNGPQILYQNSSRLVAKALDPTAIEVDMPSQYADDPVPFICQLLKLRLAKSDLGLPREAPGPIARQGKYTPPPTAAGKTSIADICRVRGEGENIYTKDGKITLALHENSVSYRVAQDVVETINGPRIVNQNDGKSVAKALDSSNIALAVPDQYRDDPVAFISQVLSLPMTAPGLEQAAAKLTSDTR